MTDDVSTASGAVQQDLSMHSWDNLFSDCLGRDTATNDVECRDEHDSDDFRERLHMVDGQR